MEEELVVPSPAITRRLGDIMHLQEEQPCFQSGSHFLKFQYACWGSELNYRWRVKDGEASVGREGSF